MREVWIIDAVRTPRGIGKVGKGALADLHPQRLLATVLEQLRDRTAIDTRDIDDLVIGCGTQQGKQGFCIGRMAALDAGYDADATAVTLDRFCGSGITAVSMAAMGIMSGMQDMVVAGGVESMSYLSTLEQRVLVDSGNLHLRAQIPQPNQGICADLIATLEGFSRDDVDGLALESQRRAGVAIAEGRFARSMVPVHRDDGTLALAQEEYPRPQTTAEALAALKPAFPALYDMPLDETGVTFRAMVESMYPDITLNHIHHAGNSSGVVDGAAGILLASADFAKAAGLKPRARIRAVANAGDNPSLMLNAPVPAARKAAKKAGVGIQDIQLWEVNEAFAVVPLKFMRDLEISPDIVNVSGGAIALGHPIGATGAILIATLLDEMERRDLSLGGATLCAAGGMAPSIVIERI